MAQSTVAASTNEAAYFNLHVSGIGYLSRVREVKPKAGRKAVPFLACAINAMHGSVQDPNYTSFDLRVSGVEAEDVVRNLWRAVDDGRKVFVAFKAGDIYAHLYQRNKRNPDGTKAEDVEPAALIKGRLLMITLAKIDDEIVFQRQAADEGPAEAAVPAQAAPAQAEPAAAVPKAAVAQRAPVAPAYQPRSAPVRQPSGVHVAEAVAA